ncbi:MAG: 6,7-dimethyl-8-ribityllumazine synthase [Ottowia sp.]|nr:6,7-dimethyl-8-ribityllumazine synthase [Ottowia sp.]
MKYVQHQSTLDGSGLRIAVVQARFNLAICEQLRDGCMEALAQLGVEGEDVLLITVPGALEIPLALQKLAQSDEFDALVALGAVVRGQTYHFELVANESAAGIQRVALDFDIPIANGVLTTEDEAQALARAAGKGRDCARVAVEMANLVEAHNQLQDDDAQDAE